MAFGLMVWCLGGLGSQGLRSYARSQGFQCYLWSAVFKSWVGFWSVGFLVIIGAAELDSFSWPLVGLWGPEETSDFIDGCLNFVISFRFSPSNLCDISGGSGGISYPSNLIPWVSLLPFNFFSRLNLSKAET